MKIIGYHITSNLIANSDGEVCTSMPWLDFLFANKGECIKVLYHMDYSVACLLAMLNLPAECLKELAETTDLTFVNNEGKNSTLPDSNIIKGAAYEVQYMPRKWFAIKSKLTRQWAGFSDMSQYADCTHDMEYSTVTCAVSAKLTGELVYETLTKLDLHPKSLTSPISAFNKEVLSKIDLPTIDDLPDEVAEYAYQCCKGSWIEAFQLGHFDDTLDFDIKSAYGSELTKLIDFRHSKWEQSKTYIANARYGYCKGIVTINKPFSPILYKSNSQTYTPTGSWETYLTKNEIDFIDKWEIGTFEIDDGHWWVQNKPDWDTKTMPLTETINSLYIRKQQSSNSFEDNIIKRIISGIWGKLGEYNEKGFGELFNPVWCAEVETNIRLKVAKFVLANNLQDDLLSIMVDGTLIKNINQPFLLSNAAESSPLSVAENTEAIGSWKLSHCCPSIIINSGTQVLRDKQSNAPFSLQYNWLLQQIEKKPKAKEYSITGLSPITLHKALKDNKLQDLGNLEEIKRTINLDSELKRCYKAQPKNGKELLSEQSNSKSWDISIVQEQKKTDD